MTVHEGLARQLLANIISDPRATATLAEVRSRLVAQPGAPDGFDVGYADAIGQVHMSTPSKWPMEQVAALARVHAGIVAGTYGMIRIGGPLLEAGPGRDADRKGNASKLLELHGPFSAEVDLEQNNADDDGTLSWDEPARIERSSGTSFIGPCSRVGMKRILMPATIEPWSVPLEIGSSSPSRTLLHLVEEGGAARWPYGADWITLFINFKPSWTHSDW